MNLAQGIKEPLIYYQRHPEQKYLDAVKTGFADIRKFNGMAHGLYGGDETLHGNNPTQGSEFCSAVEMMFSLENMLEITGQPGFADHLEKVAFNALPAQATDDFMYRQYFQQANQVMATNKMRNFETNHDGTDLCYGLLSGFPCCTANMHQGWPKFTQNLWYATADGGLAALVYSPSEVKAEVAGVVGVTFKEETNYPFSEDIKFTLTMAKRSAKASFPFHLRIPAWCKSASIRINGETWKQAEGDQVVKIEREWASGDVVELTLLMHIFRNTLAGEFHFHRAGSSYLWPEDRRGNEAGQKSEPSRLLWRRVVLRSASHHALNYGLIQTGRDKMEEHYKVEKSGAVSKYPWNLENAPVSIRTQGAAAYPFMAAVQRNGGPAAVQRHVPFRVREGRRRDHSRTSTVALT